MELYKKHRPNDLDSVVGSRSTVMALKSMLDRGTVPHALLFYGPSGCGKTTLARIVRQHLKCSDMDFMEVNSSSFRGIDTVRNVMQLIYLAPSAGPCRVWLFDEVHKWTNDAQNAALKMLEDTPNHVYFLLCTTDPNKLLAALRNRCTGMPIESISYEDLTRLVKRVARAEGIRLGEDVLDELVATSSGSARMALVYLGMMVGLKESEQLEILKNRAGEDSSAMELVRALMKPLPWAKIAAILRDLTIDAETARRSVLGYARAVMIKEGKPNESAHIILDIFREHFYDSGDAGLCWACYEVIRSLK